MYIAFLKRESNKCTKNITAECAHFFGDKTSKHVIILYIIFFEMPCTRLSSTVLDM